MKKLNNKGFTIVELVIVIAVIAILAAVLIPTFSGVVGKANESAALQTAHSTLTNALNMSSTAQLTGRNVDNVEKTVFLVDGYAFGYTGNQLVAINYPQGTTVLKKGADAKNGLNFNAILISADNMSKTEVKYTQDEVNADPDDDITSTDQVKSVSYAVKDDIAKIITDATDLADVNVTLVGTHYYVNYAENGEGAADDTWDAEIFVNSDFSKKVVVFTTFG